MQLLIRNARIASENESTLRDGDVLVVDGVIRSIGSALTAPEGAKVIDARGRLLMPAMFDAHVHFREPGQEAKETIATGSEAAINGGITGIVMMPNTSPAIDSPAVVKQVLESAAKTSRIPIYTSGCVT
ncbi:MAG TPA: amidohydrolase family protein, partial [Luteolibacter sp.]